MGVVESSDGEHITSTVSDRMERWIAQTHMGWRKYEENNRKMQQAKESSGVREGCRK